MIRLLDKHLVNKIAAGEVIERPASIVKELIENSLDAGATSISIHVKDGGKGQINVIDDGSGMGRTDLLMSYKPHTTSKIATADDLFSIRSLGFRGEALSSIAAVSRVEIASRTKDDDEGTAITVEAGELVKTEKRGMPRGTSIDVRDLFFNTPARRKHLKGNRVEGSHITDVVTRYALSREGLCVRLIMDGKEILNVPATKDLLNKIVDVYGKETAKHMLKVCHDADSIKVHGYIGKPYLARKDLSQQNLFVNSRSVKSQTITNALYDAYHTLLFLERNPACVLFIDIDPQKIDVNVHPQKEIIRIEDESLMYRTVFEAVRKVFDDNSLVPDVEVDETAYVRKPTKQYGLIKEEQQLLAPISQTSRDLVRTEVQRKIGPVRILGQVNRLYIIAEGVNGMLIIDQHAAQERVYFERYMRQYDARDVIRQRLMKPLIMEVQKHELDSLMENKGLLDSMGFEVSLYGKNTIRISQVPDVFGVMDEELVKDIVNELGASKAVDMRVEERVARMSCRKAIKAGDLLSLPQMEKLVASLEDCEKPYACPHGRPTIISIPNSELEKKFKRVN